MFNKGHSFWLGKKRINISGNNHFAWKGDLVGKIGLHKWVERNLGKPNYCEDCKKSIPGMYHWANISGEYKRNTSDWKRLCPKCHRNFDKSCIVKGELHGMSKFKDEQILDIRKKHRDEKLSTVQLSRIYNVDRHTIYRIVNRLTWKHVEEQ